MFRSFCFCSVAICVLVPNKVLFWIYYLKFILTPFSIYQEKLIHFCCHVMNNSCGIFFHWEYGMCTDIRFLFITFSLIFSSPEPKAQVSFSDQNLSVVRRCLQNHCCSPEPLSQFQANLAQSIIGWRGFKFVQMKGPALFKGVIITK